MFIVACIDSRRVYIYTFFLLINNIFFFQRECFPEGAKFDLLVEMLIFNRQ